MKNTNQSGFAGLAVGALLALFGMGVATGIVVDHQYPKTGNVITQEKR